MNKNLKVSKSIVINATTEELWNTITEPEKIKQFLFGTETITDWQIGSSIVFQGEYQGHKYRDKGVVIENQKNKLLQYSYWSGFSGLEDKPENYSLVSWIIDSINQDIQKFTWQQEGFATEDAMAHTETGLGELLNQLKAITEKV